MLMVQQVIPALLTATVQLFLMATMLVLSLATIQETLLLAMLAKYSKYHVNSMSLSV